MFDGWLIGVLSALIAFLTFLFGMAFDASMTENSCKRIGTFYISERVYTCEYKGMK